MITVEGFYKGRDKVYADSLTPEIQANSLEAIKRVNQLLEIFYSKNKNAHDRDATSGWRPPEVNKKTEGASKKSKHMLGQAIDVEDDDEMLDTWCMSEAGRKAMQDIGLWLEHPSATPRWCHLQIVPPGSGNRVYFP